MSGAGEQVYPSRHTSVGVDVEREVVARDNRAVEVLRDESHTADLGVDLRDDELAAPNHVLRLGFDLVAIYLVAEHDAAPMQHHTQALVLLLVGDPELCAFEREH